MIEKKLRVVDMMCSMHSVLHKKYARRAVFLDVCVMVFSSILFSFTFSEPNTLSDIGVSERMFKYINRASSVCVFCLSIAAIIIDWRGKSANHKQAFDVSNSLKSELRNALEFGGDSEKRDACKNADRSLAALVPIPDSDFLRLKAWHLHKIAVSKALSENPSSFAFIASLKLRIRGLTNSKQAGQQ